MSVSAPRSSGRADVLIAGGGTAGHVLPAMTIARALVREGREASTIRFVGASRGMDAHLVADAGFAVTLLPGRGIVRRLSWSNVEALVGLCAAYFASLRLIRHLRPKVVVTVGGFASVAPALAGALCRVPILTVSLDVVPGAANRLVGRFARYNAVVDASAHMPHAVVTGTPVREEVLAVDTSDPARAARRRALDVGPTQSLVLVAGGSLGARRLNDAAIGLARRWKNRSDIVLYHVTGARDAERVAALREQLDLKNSTDSSIDYRLSSYEDRLYDLIASADLVICRAGASTVAELAVLAAPSVLVPLPGAPGDHQQRNAQSLEEVGATVVVQDDVATPDHLGPLVEALLTDSECLGEMRRGAQGAAVRDGAQRVAALVEDLAGTGSSDSERVNHGHT